MKKFLLISIISILSVAANIEGSYQIAVLKYNGGGDWYANPTSIPNLINFCNKNIGTNFKKEVPYIAVGSPEIFNYPILDITGHGNISFSLSEAENLRNYLIGGGFLHISDNYGMDQFIRPQIKKVFPELEFIELPFSHKIYHQSYNFETGLPKIHEHDSDAPKGFGLIFEGRLVCFYDFECDLGDGWEDWEVHKDSEATREKAFKMGANIVEYALTNPSN